MRKLLIGSALISLFGCHSNWHYVPYPYSTNGIPLEPDYAQVSSWAALPDQVDAADMVPDARYQDQQDSADVDVFFIHPTTFFEKDARWNAPIDDEKVNVWTNQGPIQHQASVFNGSCKVYAPRYRQAHIKSYWNLEEGGISALQLAYSDVEKAFEYYMKHYNLGRPIVIASHSQGTTHALEILRKYFDGKELQMQLVAAYLVGMPVKKNEFEEIPPCTSSNDVGCFVSWMTFDKGHLPPFYSAEYEQNQIHNPITWHDNHSHYSSCEEHLGIVVSKFELKYEQTICAMPHMGVLWIKKPKVPVLKHFIWRNNWHKADYNLFWGNIRENVAVRGSKFSEQ